MEVVSDLYFFRRTVLHGGGVSRVRERGGPGSVQRGWPAAENSNGFPLLFSHVSQFERNALWLAIY